jgi:hypothetical protein
MNWMDSFKLRTYLFFKLPAAFWSGVRVSFISHSSCEVVIRHSWFNQNPFGSVYFACMSMAAEMSSGFPAMNFIRNERQSVSMLVLRMESQFHKKAKGRIRFVFDQVEALTQAIRESMNSTEPVVFIAESKGFNKDGDLVAVFKVEWTFKAKKG